MAKKHYSYGYMIYGCMECNKGFKMWLEEGLEPFKKPVPFAIQCPFCGGYSCYDVGMKVYKTPGIHRIKGDEPYFANVPGDECGKPTHMSNAKVEFVKQATDDKMTAVNKQESPRKTEAEVYDSLFQNCPEMLGK